MEVTVKDGQTLSDIAVQEYGTCEAALEIAMRNGLSLTDTPGAGTILRLPDKATENRVMATYCKAHGVSPATAKGESGRLAHIFTENFTEQFT